MRWLVGFCVCVRHLRCNSLLATEWVAGVCIYAKLQHGGVTQVRCLVTPGPSDYGREPGPPIHPIHNRENRVVPVSLLRDFVIYYINANTVVHLSLQCYWLPKKGEPSLGPLLGQRIPFSFRSGALCRVASIRITQRYFYYALLAMWTHPDGQWSYLSQAFSFRCRC